MTSPKRQQGWLPLLALRARNFLHPSPAVDDEHLTRHVRRGIRRQEDRRADEILRLSMPAQRRAADEGLVSLPIREQGRGEARLDQTRCERVDADTARSQLL